MLQIVFFLRIIPEVKWLQCEMRAFLCETRIPYQVWCQGVSSFNGDHRCLIKSCNRAQAGIGSIHPGIYRPSSVRTDVPVEILYSEQRRRKAAACLCRQRAWWELLVALWCPLSREESRNRYSLLMVWSAAGSNVQFGGGVTHPHR